MSTLESAIGQLPEPILRKLDSMIRRVRRLLFVRGLFATLTVALGCLIAIMVIDASVTLFSSTSRWILSLAGLAVTLVAAWRFLARPLSKKFTLTHMARILEIRHPELQERISTAVELLSSDDPDSIRGSEELISAVVDSAVVDVEAVDPKTEFNTERTRKFRNAAIAFAACLLLAVAIWPQQSLTLLARAVAPFLDIGNAYADSLVVEPGDVRISEGAELTVEVSVQHKRLRRAEIRRTLPDGTESVERLRLVGEDEDGTRRFAMTFPRVEEDFAYRIRAGSALTRRFDVDTVAPPRIDQLSVTYDYPDYTGLPDGGGPTETGEIRAVAHTRVTVAAVLNKEVQVSGLFLNKRNEVSPATVEGRRHRWSFPLQPGMKGSWSLALTDLDGFEGEPVDYPLEVLPDKAPTVQIIQPTLRELRLRPVERLPIESRIVEDFGLRDFTLLITPLGANRPVEIPQPDPRPSGSPGQFTGTAELNLAALDLEPNQTELTAQLRARDNRPGDYDGPGVGLSEVIHIVIDKRARSLADQAIEAQKKEVRESLDEAKRELQRARDQIRKAERQLQRSDEVSREAREQLENFSEHTDEARDQLDQVNASLRESLFREQAEKARQIADETIAEAKEKADLAPVLDQRNERAREAREARKKVEEAINEVDELRKEMNKADDDYEMISELNELATKQQELAMNTEDWAREAEAQRTRTPDPSQPSPSSPELSPQEKRELENFRKQQEQRQKELGEMLKDNASALDEILEEQRAESSRMAEQATALAQEQDQLRELNREALEADSAAEESLRGQLIDLLEQKQSELAREAGTLAEAESMTSPESGEAASDSPEDSPADAPASEGNASTQPETARVSPTDSPSATSDGASGSETEPSPAQPESPSSAEMAQAAASDSDAETAASEPSSARAGEEPDAAVPAAQPPSDASRPTGELAEAASRASEAAAELGAEDLDAASESASEAGEMLAEAAASEAATPETSGSDAAAEDTTSTSPEADASAAETGRSETEETSGDNPESSALAEASAAPDASGGEPSSGPAGRAANADNAPGEPGEPASGEPASPELPSLAARSDLAARQQALAEQIEAVRNGNLQEALAQLESTVSEEAAALQSAAESMEEGLENLSMNGARSNANQAEQALSNGAREAGDAARELDRAQQQQSRAEAEGKVESGELASAAADSMNRSMAEQQRTTNYLERAAQALEATSQSIGRTQEGLEPSDMDQRIADSSDLAEGFQEMSQSAQSRSAEEAARNSQQAAEAMQQLAQAAMQKLGMPGGNQPQPQPGPPGEPQPDMLTGEPTSDNLNESGLKTADMDGSGIPPELEALGINAEDWTRFRGALAGGNATAIETELPAEYRELVGRYFQVIAKEAGKKK